MAQLALEFEQLARFLEARDYCYRAQVIPLAQLVEFVLACNGNVAGRSLPRQLTRYQGEKIFCNAQMSPRQLRKYCNISAECEGLLETAMWGFR